MKMLTVNTVLTAALAILFGLISFLGTEIYKKVYATNESLVVIQATMVNQVQLEQVRSSITALQTKQTELQQRQDAISLEIRRMKQTHP